MVSKILNNDRSVLGAQWLTFIAFMMSATLARSTVLACTAHSGWRNLLFYSK